MPSILDFLGKEVSPPYSIFVCLHFKTSHLPVCPRALNPSELHLRTRLSDVDTLEFFPQTSETRRHRRETLHKDRVFQQ